MGVGGLLKDVTARPLPRARATAGHTVAAVVLAAGQSSRMAPRHKLLVEDAAGRTMIARVVDAVVASKARPILVVTGPPRGGGAGGARRPPRAVCPCSRTMPTGLSASLRAGLAAVPANALGGRRRARRHAAGHRRHDRPPDRRRSIRTKAAPSSRRSMPARLGNPVLWDRRYFPAMMALTGDSGARCLAAPPCRSRGGTRHRCHSVAGFRHAREPARSALGDSGGPASAIVPPDRR